MARVVVEHLLCDAHLAQEVQVSDEVETTPLVQIGTDKPKRLDLCKDCRTDMFEPFVELLKSEGRTETGRRGGGGKRKNKPQLEAVPDEQPAAAATEPTRTELPSFTCPTCSRTFGKAQALGAHRARKHGYRAGDDAAAG